MAGQQATKSFASLFRNSKFVKLGDFRNSTVHGKIFHINNNDLYVDIGMKFHAVVQKPSTDNRLFVRDAVVKLKLIDYEITDRFIGSKEITSILEADAILLGLVSTPVGSIQRIDEIAKQTIGQKDATISENVQMPKPAEAQEPAQQHNPKQDERPIEDQTPSLNQQSIQDQKPIKDQTSSRNQQLIQDQKPIRNMTRSQLQQLLQDQRAGPNRKPIRNQKPFWEQNLHSNEDPFWRQELVQDSRSARQNPTQRNRVDIRRPLVRNPKKSDDRNQEPGHDDKL